MDSRLKGIALNSAAAAYGAKHHRRILAVHGLKRGLPVLLIGIPVVAVIWAVGKSATVVARPEHRMSGLLIVGGLFLFCGATALVVRRLRSPYRRRRFRP